MNGSQLRNLRTAAKAALVVAILGLVGYLGVWQWTFCRIEVPPGHSLLIRYKGPWPFGAAPRRRRGPW